MSKKTIWIIVALVGAYIICQAIADVTAAKLIQVGSIVMPAGTLVFAATFTVRDLLHKRLGKDWARAAIVMAGTFNIVQAGYFAVVSRLPSPFFYTYNEAWAGIFAIVPAVTIASIIAEIASELVDTEIYHTVARGLPGWLAVLLSNMVSLPLDSFIFGSLAFVIFPPLFEAEALPFVTAMGLVAGQIVWKSIITVVSLPAIYLVGSHGRE